MAGSPNVNEKASKIKSEDDKQETDESSNANKLSTAFVEKSNSLANSANNAFKEFSKFLEKEQSRLMEIEDRRKRLQEEMQRLKQEIEDEKQTYLLESIEIDENVPLFYDDDLEPDAMGTNLTSMTELETCYEEEEPQGAEGGAKFAVTRKY